MNGLCVGIYRYYMLGGPKETSSLGFDDELGPTVHVGTANLAERTERNVKKVKKGRNVTLGGFSAERTTSPASAP